MHLSLAASLFDYIKPEHLFMLLGGVALIFTIRRWRMNVVRRNRVREQEPAPSANPLNVREVATEISALLADLEETARRVAAQIENRKIALDLLIREADEKIRRLEALQRTVPMPDQRPTTASLSPDAAQLINRLRLERGAPTPTEDPAYRPIYQLADAGKSPREIAQQLNRQPGEIDLILALRPRQRA